MDAEKIRGEGTKGVDYVYLDSVFVNLVLLSRSYLKSFSFLNKLDKVRQFTFIDFFCGEFNWLILSVLDIRQIKGLVGIKCNEFICDLTVVEKWCFVSHIQSEMEADFSLLVPKLALDFVDSHIAWFVWHKYIIWKLKGDKTGQNRIVNHIFIRHTINDWQGIASKFTCHEIYLLHYFLIKLRRPLFDLNSVDKGSGSD